MAARWLRPLRSASGRYSRDSICGLCGELFVWERRSVAARRRRHPEATVPVRGPLLERRAHGHPSASAECLLYVSMLSSVCVCVYLFLFIMISTMRDIFYIRRWWKGQNNSILEDLPWQSSKRRSHHGSPTSSFSELQCDEEAVGYFVC